MENNTDLDKNKENDISQEGDAKNIKNQTENSTARTPSKVPMILTIISACVLVITLNNIACLNALYKAPCQGALYCLEYNIRWFFGFVVCLPLSIIALANRKKGRHEDRRLILLLTNIGIIIMFVLLFFYIKFS